MRLNDALACLEEQIDPARRQASERLHVAAMDFLPVPYLPISIEYPLDRRVAPFPYAECFDDMEKMLFNELTAVPVNPLNAVALGDDYPLQIRPNYGVGLICSLFGCESVVKADGMPWVKPLRSPDELRAMVDRGVPPLDAGLGRRARACCEYFREALSPYEKCARFIHVTQPDLQGPFDILHLLLGSSLFYLLYDEPELIRDALRLIGETYVAYHRYIEPYTTALMDGGRKCVVHRAIYGGTLVLKDDTATATLSGDMYGEFVAPANAAVLRALNDTDKPRMGSIHFCGARKAWHDGQMIGQPVGCLNFGNPEMRDFADEFRLLRDAGICVVGMGQEQNYGLVKKYIDAGVRTGVTLLIRADSFEDAQSILRAHRNGE